MENSLWSFARLSTSSRSNQSPLKSHSEELFLDFEEIEGDDDSSTEYPCPFCTDDFNLVELCCHIDDEHPLEEATFGVCPVCATRVGVNMVEHITTQHGNMFNSFRKMKLRKIDSHSTLPLLKKELEDEYLQSLLSGSSSVVSSSKMVPDPLLSFLYNTPFVDKHESEQLDCLTEVTLEEKSSDEKTLERNIRPSPLSDEEQMEKAKRCEFVQGLLTSTMFDDSLQM